MSGRGPVRPARRLRGLPWRSAEYASLDFEATGLDFARDRVISFGAVPIRKGRIEVGEAVYQLVDPGDRPPSAESITVHGIRPVDLREAPSLEAARTNLARALDRRFLIAWYAGVEAAFLSSWFGGGPRRWQRSTIDVRDLMLALEGPSVGRLSLSVAAERFGVPVADPHHALDDALVTAQLFLVLANRLVERGGVRIVGDLLAIDPAARAALRRPSAPF